VEEDAQGRRLHLHLTQAATGWAAGGRDPSELFGGARLAATLEWADAGGDAIGLNRLEREFLEQSRTAFARANRRLRILLAAAAVLLALAIVAGAIAVVARGSAKRQATAAIAQRLGAQALVEPQLDRGLLLAREGVALNDNTATQSNLLAALLRSPAAIAVLHGGGTQVLDDALSRDGRLLAARGDNGSVTVFDTRSLREVGPRFQSVGQLIYFGAITRPVRALAFSSDGHALAIGDSDGTHATLALIDTRSLRKSSSLTDKAAAATADVEFSPDGRTLVTGEAVSGRFPPPAEVLVARRPSDGSPIRRSRPIAGGRLIGFAQGGRSLLVTSGEHASYLLDARTFARRATFHLSGAAALSRAGNIAAFGQNDGSVTLLSLETGKMQLLGRASGRVLALAFDADGKVLATASDDGSIDVWDVPTASLRETFKGHAGAARGVAFSPDGATLYSASSDGSVFVWDVRGERRLGRLFRFDPVPAPGMGVHVPAQAAGAVAVSPDSSLFVTSPGPNRVTLWRSRDLAVLGELRGPVGGVESLAWSHDGQFVAGTGDQETVVWDVATRKVARRFARPAQGGNAGVNFSADDRLLGTAGIDGGLRVYNLRTGRRIADVHVNGTLQDLDFSSGGTLLAAAGLSGDIAIWDLVKHRLARTIHHDGGLQSIRFSPDGRTIVTGDFRGNVDFWDASTGRKAGRTLGGQNGDVLSVTYSPNGTQLMTTSTDGQFRLWDLASGKLVGSPLPGADVGGWGTFFPDGTRVIATFWSGIGVVWNVDPAAWGRQACRIAHRTLTRAEWHDFVPERPYRPVCG
jgi:WD40 repeat protein